MTIPTELLARQREMEQAIFEHLGRADALLRTKPLMSGEIGYTTGPATTLKAKQHIRAALDGLAARTDRALLLDVIEAAQRAASVSERGQRAALPLLRARLDALFAAWEATR